MNNNKSFSRVKRKNCVGMKFGFLTVLKEVEKKIRIDECYVNVSVEKKQL